MSVALDDVQGLLRGYGRSFDRARHFFVAVGDAQRARAFVGTVADDASDGPVVTSLEARKQRPSSCLNLAITWPGLKALGVPAGVLAQFPPAFQQGPAIRAQLDPTRPHSVGLGDVGPSDPETWTMGGPNNPEIHLILSLYAQGSERLEEASSSLRSALAAHRLTERSHHDAQALPAREGKGRVHFGYRDGIAEPSIAGFAPRAPDMQPEVPTGDMLLGCDYENSFGGNYAGNLPGELVDNATYGAFRILYQDVAGFEQLLRDWGEEASADPEVIAAKLMGRWRNGAPLVLSPDISDPNPSVPDHELNAFDYAPGPDHPAFYDDARGLRCPIGAHVRRLNPRGARVMGTRTAGASYGATCPTARSSRRAHPTTTSTAASSATSCAATSRRSGSSSRRRGSTRTWPRTASAARASRSVARSPSQAARSRSRRPIPGRSSCADCPTWSAPAEAPTACCRGSAVCATSRRYPARTGEQHERDDDDDHRAGGAGPPAAEQAGPQTVPSRMLAWWGNSDLPHGADDAPALTQAQWEATYRLLENAALDDDAVKPLGAVQAATRDFRPDGPLPIAIASFRVAMPRPEVVRSVRAAAADGNDVRFPPASLADAIQERRVFAASALLHDQWGLQTPATAVATSRSSSRRPSS